MKCLIVDAKSVAKDHCVSKCAYISSLCFLVVFLIPSVALTNEQGKDLQIFFTSTESKVLPKTVEEGALVKNDTVADKTANSVSIMNPVSSDIDRVSSSNGLKARDSKKQIRSRLRFGGIITSANGVTALVNDLPCNVNDSSALIEPDLSLIKKSSKLSQDRRLKQSKKSVPIATAVHCKHIDPKIYSLSIRLDRSELNVYRNERRVGVLSVGQGL